ncbi:MAG: class I SAM-dependent methyltransferase [Clostridiales bacterium]|nr:class I SAM-dependent methyltransferase [Clostridiales bacterium]
MHNNISAFDSKEYDKKIVQTLPYYEEFYRQVIDVVKNYNNKKTMWLDVGCGTGKMAEFAFREIDIEKFVFCDNSDGMINIAKQRFYKYNAQFDICDILELQYHKVFDVITAIQVNHYFNKEERIKCVHKYYNALKPDGIYISFENFAPFSEIGKNLYLNRWKNYQLQQGKSLMECEEHISRYGKDYYPISITEQVDIMHSVDFKAVEILWLSNMQVGILAIK